MRTVFSCNERKREYEIHLEVSCVRIIWQTEDRCLDGVEDI